MAQNVLSSLGETADRKLHELTEVSREKFEKIKRKSLEDLYGDTREWVRENPGKTLLGALATGFLIGSILRRR